MQYQFLVILAQVKHVLHSGFEASKVLINDCIEFYQKHLSLWNVKSELHHNNI